MLFLEEILDLIDHDISSVRCFVINADKEL